MGAKPAILGRRRDRTLLAVRPGRASPAVPQRPRLRRRQWHGYPDRSRRFQRSTAARSRLRLVLPAATVIPSHSGESGPPPSALHAGRDAGFLQHEPARALLPIRAGRGQHPRLRRARRGAAQRRSASRARLYPGDPQRLPRDLRSPPLDRQHEIGRAPWPACRKSA